MKDYALMLAIGAGILIAVGGLIYGLRKFSEATTPLTVREVEPGIKCASLITTDGAAIDCWHVKP